MQIDSADLIRKLPMMIQGNKTFAKFSEGGDYHIGEVDSWCLNYKEIVEGIESYCEYKRTNQYKLGAPVNGSFALNSYDYDEPQTVQKLAEFQKMCSIKADPDRMNTECMWK